ncbi:DEAD/DEAH box helicase [Oxalobacter sp. OttesenSCG-928-P03]|nr:DEAD/DEAH box helicase [Oxalobacter sp. OttesenSCG-928-P03]
MNFSQEDIQKQFDEATYQAGLDYAKHDYVKQVQLAANLIRSQVKGPGNQVFQQNIFLKSTVKGLLFQGTCTCSDHTNCKHVVSVLVTVLRKKKMASAQPVSAPVASWLQRLRSATFGASDPVAAPDTEIQEKPSQRLLYILSPDQADRRTFLGMCKVRFRPNGEIASATPVSDPPALLTEKPDYIQPEDDGPIRLFIAMRGGHVPQGQNLVEPRGPIGAQLLRILIDRQQLLWTNSWSDIGKGLLFPLRAAPPREARLVWLETESTLRLSWEFAPLPENGENRRTAKKQRIDYILPTEPAWYMDNLTCGELILPTNDTGISVKDLQELVSQAPPVPIKDKTAVSRMLITQGLSELIPPPESMKESVRKDIRPTPVLRLGSMQNKGTAQAELSSWYDYAQLLFDYDGQQVFYGTSVPIMRAQGAAIERILRNEKMEAGFFDTLHQAGFVLQDNSGLSHTTLPGLLDLPSQSDWMQFTSVIMPELKKQGWHIEKTQEYRYDIAEIEDWYARVTDESKSSGKDWFSLELGIVVNKQRISLLPLLVTLIRTAPEEFDPKKLGEKPDHEALLTTLPDGLRVALPWGRIKPILRTLGELYFTDRDDHSIRLHALDSPRLAELSKELPLHWLNGERLLEMGTRLAEFDGVQKVHPPKTLRASLRDYQLEGLSWMQFLREYELAGILADDMGLGKTLQTLSHILLEKEAGRLTQPALVVAPTSLMSNWQEEAERFAPELRVLVLQGKDRIKRFERIEQYDLVLTTYALLPRDEQELQEHEYHLLILDESQYIKNIRSKAAQIATTLRARHRLCLTGTPLENHLGELWSQFHFLLPGLLGNEKTFNSEFRHPIEKLADDNRRALLARRIRPFLLRRTKDKVADELPPKTEMVRNVELTSSQRDIYETVRLAMDKKIRDEIAKKGVARSQIVILDALLKLRQVCCDPRLLRGGANRKAAMSAKLAALMEMVEELLLENRRILVFSQFTSMLALIEAEFKARNFSYTVLTGDTVDRAGAIRTFQEGHVPLFLISLKAGGVGLNLTAADTVIHYDPWWNPAVENQATDRAWRIGQDKPVFVYKLIARGTLEEKIQELQQKKADLADAILSTGETQSVQITPEDLQAIFEPLESIGDDELEFGEMESPPPSPVKPAKKPRK